MARIRYADPQSLDPETRRLLERLPQLNLFRMLAHAESALPRYVRMGNALLTKGSLDPVLREMVILRVGHLCRAAYEIHQHERISRDLQMPEDKLRAPGPVNTSRDRRGGACVLQGKARRASVAAPT